MGTRHAFTRSDITFESEGTECAAWLYRPDALGLPPIVVLAHGFGGFRDLRLDAYAARFAEAGYAALVFDYRHWGASAGHPRRILDIGKQHADWRAAVTHARALDGIDTSRVVAWGTSFAGGHVLDLAVTDHHLAAVIAQVPHVSGTASAFTQPVTAQLRLAVAAVRDQLGSWVGRPPYRVPSVGRPGETAMMTSPGAMDLMNAMAGENVDEFAAENSVAARVALRVPFYSPGRRVAGITAPTLVAIAERDDVTPVETALAVARRIPNAEIVRYDCGHFEPYLDPLFDRVVGDQIEFLERHVPVDR